MLLVDPFRVPQSWTWTHVVGSHIGNPPALDLVVGSILGSSGPVDLDIGGGQRAFSFFAKSGRSASNFVVL